MKSSKQKKLNRLTLVLIIVGFLSSCGGGGGGTTSPLPIDTSSSDWDSMVWGQDDWG
ncbi:MAG: hypothetical protein KUG78_21960 [Kangiellaceae bacterium]|nr:hypothetical protein [Kangiellaceae bacterium]